jgi:hypothetical protein
VRRGVDLFIGETPAAMTPKATFYFGGLTEPEPLIDLLMRRQSQPSGIRRRTVIEMRQGRLAPRRGLRATNLADQAAAGADLKSGLGRFAEPTLCCPQRFTGVLMKSRLASSMPQWRRMSYAVVQ